MKDPAAAESIGLCATCKNARQIVSDRGSVFWQCKLAAVDARFPKYPRLPVLACAGYEKTPAASKGPITHI